MYICKKGGCTDVVGIHRKSSDYGVRDGVRIIIFFAFCKIKKQKLCKKIEIPRGRKLIFSLYVGKLKKYYKT